MARRRPASTTNYSTNYSSNPATPGYSASIKLAIAAAIFAIGIGVGVALTTLNPTANTVDAISLDVGAPSRDFCNNYGSSAMVTTVRIYTTLNPYNVFVSQVEPAAGCVVLPNNWNILLQRSAINDQQIRQCKDRMNTFGYTGELDKNPEVNCVYESRDARQKLFGSPTPKPTPSP
jgi:hypothetical protein